MMSWIFNTQGIVSTHLFLPHAIGNKLTEKVGVYGRIILKRSKERCRFLVGTIPLTMALSGGHC